MPLDVSKPTVWAADLTDQPGGLAEKLGALSGTAANLEFLIARRKPEAPGQGVVFMAPIEGRKAQDAARAAGMNKTDVPTVRVEGADRPGIGGEMMQAISDLGINLRGVSAAVVGRRFVAYLGFDSMEDANKAVRALKGFEPAGRPTRRAGGIAPGRAVRSEAPARGKARPAARGRTPAR